MDKIALTNVRVFDGERLLEPATVVIDGDCIGTISARAPADARAADVVDGGGGALLPGLIDTHVHVDKVSQLEASASWGITTLLDMGNKDLANLARLKNGQGLPTLKSAGNPASAPNSVFVTKMGFSVTTTVTGPQDAPRFVDERAAEGSDYIKILVEDPKVPGTRALGAQTVAALVVAAHRAGLMTVAHVVSADTMTTAVRAGVDIVTHTALTSDLGPDLVALLAEREVVIIPTLTMMQGVVRAIGGRLAMRVLAPFVPAVRLNYRHAKSTVATFRDAGAVILAGTDSNDDLTAPYQVAHGESLHEELERLVGSGLAPAEALRGATSLAAATFGLTDRGVIAPGRRADLVLVDGDPTRDISASRNIRGVWIGGRQVKP
ncbi:MAG TPA: amidohydrolase family protein [Trebonia sp.]